MSSHVWLMYPQVRTASATSGNGGLLGEHALQARGSLVQIQLRPPILPGQRHVSIILLIAANARRELTVQGGVVPPSDALANHFIGDDINVRETLRMLVAPAAWW
jgi:hypothetical protein